MTDQSGTTIIQSTPLAITWRPWVMTLTGGGLLGNTDKGTLTVQAEHAVTAPNLTLVVVDTNGTTSDSQVCAQTLCNLAVGPQTGTHKYVALVVNRATTDVAGASSTVSFQWCPAAMHNGACDPVGVTLSADHDQLPVGGTASLTAKADTDLSGTGAHIVITNDNGAKNDCPSEAQSCTWQVKETSPVTRNYTARVELSDGSTVGPESNSVQIEWKPYVIVSLLPASQRVIEGRPATLTAESNLALLPGYSMKLFEDNGNESSSCTNEAGSCTWQATESIPGKHTFHAEIFDDNGNRVDTGGDVTAEVEWVTAWTGTIAISVDNNLNHPPVGVKPTIRAVVSGNTLNGTGYTIHITSSAGGSWSCPDTADNCFVNTETATTVGTSRTYHAYVADLQSAHAADSPADVTVTWTPWNVSLQLDPTQLPVPSNGSVNAPILPLNAPFVLSITRGAFNIDGLDLHWVETGGSGPPVTDTTSPEYVRYGGCTAPTQGTEEAVIEDASGNVVSNQATLAVACQSWNLRGYWDNATQAANYMLAPGITATLTATTDFEVAGTGYTIAIFGTNGQTPDARCPQTTGCREGYTNGGNGSVSPVLGVYDPQGTAVTPSVPVSTVTWGSSGSGGGGGSISMTADTTDPPAGGDATMTVSGGPLQSGYQIKIEDPGNGYVSTPVAAVT